MARLGELLVASGLLTIEQVEQALRAQVMWGGRLGTNLIELGYVDLDTLAQTLGRQHKLAPALARHFDKADRELQKQLSADVAERYSAVPLMRIGPQKMVVFASVTVIDKRGLAIIADELAITPAQLIPSIAAELRIRYHLERAYKIPRGTRFLRSRGKTIPPFPQFEIVPLAFEDSEVDITLPNDTSELPIVQPDAVVAQPPAIAKAPPAIAPTPAERPAKQPSGLAARIAALEESGAIDEVEPAELEPELEYATTETTPGIDDYSAIAITTGADTTEDDLAVPTEPIIDEPSGRDRRRYVRTITDQPATDSERQALGRIAIRRVAIAGANAGATLGEATRAIRRGLDRDKVAELVVGALDRFVPTCDAAILLVVRGEVALGWKGFSRSGATLPEIGVPLEQPGLVPRAVQRGHTVRSPSTDLGPIDQLLLVSLGRDTGDLVVVPVTIADQVMCVIALVASSDAKIESAESIAGAAGAAFARLMRNASR